MSKLVVPLVKAPFRLQCRQNSPICWPKPTYGPAEVHRSQFLNGLKVAATKHMGAQITACTIMFQAGSRFECDVDLGATHFIRACTLASGLGASGFMKMRYVMQHGGYVTVNSDRQTISFTLRCPMPVFNDLKNYLLDTALRCRFLDHEIDDKITSRVHEDLKVRTPEQRVIDLVQRACWGGTLKNSSYCEESRIDSMSGETLMDYVKRNFITTRCTIASSGASFDETIKVAEHFDCGKTEKPQDNYCFIPSFPRAGFEVHDLGANAFTYIALCLPSCGHAALGELIKYNILAAACGYTSLHAGTHYYDKTIQPPIGCLACDEFTSYNAFNISYMETGVFGILAKTRAKTARQVALSAASFLFSVNCLTRQQIEIGKKRLKVSMALHEGDCVKVSESLALQLASGYAFDSVRDTMAMIDATMPEEITQVASCLSAKRAQMAMAVVGDAAQTPHLGELMRCG